MTHERSLDDLGLMQGTDKSSIRHGYLAHYDRILGPLRHDEITMLEIGVDRGGSLRMWLDYFTRATIVGVDIDPARAGLAGDRCFIEIGNQADAAFMRAIGEKWRPAVIVDDGSHQADHIMVSFNALFPLLRPGGVYIVEDVSMHHGETGEHYRGQAEIFPHKAFLNLANQVSVPAEDAGFDRGLAHMTAAVEFVYGAIVIRKRPEPEPWPIPRRRAIARQADRAELWVFFAEFILRNGGAPSEAVECCLRAVEREPENSFFLHVLGQAREAAGDLAGALQSARRAAELAPGHDVFADRVAGLSAVLGVEA